MLSNLNGRLGLSVCGVCDVRESDFLVFANYPISPPTSYAARFDQLSPGHTTCITSRFASTVFNICAAILHAMSQHALIADKTNLYQVFLSSNGPFALLIIPVKQLLLPQISLGP